METDANKVSPSLEDYLETIYFIYLRSGHGVRVTDIAAEMNISKPSVNKAVNILKSQDLVNHEHYGNLTLTEKGLQIAKGVAKRHLTIKRFLQDILEVDAETAEREACLVEHAMSLSTVNLLEKHMERFLQNTKENE